MKIKKMNENISRPNFHLHHRKPVVVQKLSEPEKPKDAYEDPENPIDEFPNSVESYGPSLGKGKQVYETFTKLYTIKTIDNYTH